MFTKLKVTQSMVDAVNKVLDEASAPIKEPTSTGMKVYGRSYGNSAKAKQDQTKSSVDDLKGPKTKEHCYNLSIAKKGKPSSKKGKKTGPNLKLKGRKSYHKEDTGKKISEAKKGKQVNGLKILDIKNNIIFFLSNSYQSSLFSYH